jgi:hypothetical protein
MQPNQIEEYLRLKLATSPIETFINLTALDDSIDPDVKENGSIL